LIARPAHTTAALLRRLGASQRNSNREAADLDDLFAGRL
jgi:hypothetical protein